MIIDQERERRNEAKAYRLEGEAIGERRGKKIGERRGKKIGERRGEKRMKELKERVFVQALIKEGMYDDRKIASLVGVEERFVRQERQLQSRIN